MGGDHDNMEQFHDLLKRLILDEQRIVTSNYLLRHTSLNAERTQRVFETFLEANKSDHSMLNATYCLLGPLKECPNRKCCTIVRQEEVEKAKQRLTKIDICNIFSIQAVQIKEIEELFILDWTDQNDDNNGNQQQFKGFLKDSEADKAYSKWAKKAGKSPVKFYNIPEPEKQIVQQEKQRQNSPTPEKTPSPKKKAKKRIMIESDDEEVLEKAEKRILIESDDEEVLEKAKEENDSRLTKEDARNDAVDDLFCTGDDSDAEIWNEVEMHEEKDQEKNEENISPEKKGSNTKKKQKERKEEKSGERKRTERKIEWKKADGENTKWREEKVTETFVDEDGMLVTRMTSKMVKTECGEEKSCGSSQALAKRPAARTVNNVETEKQQKGKKEQPKGKGEGKQATILSFFNKR